MYTEVMPIYHTNKNLFHIQNELQIYLNKVSKVYHNWSSYINLTKTSAQKFAKGVPQLPIPL